MGVLSLNDRAMIVADELASRAEELGGAVSKAGRVRIIDVGVEAAGSLEAGLLTARTCMADLGKASLSPMTVCGVMLPGVAVDVRFPVAACMASQYAGWQIQVGDYFAMGSGPMRAAAGKEELFDKIGFREQPNRAVGVLETGVLPTEEVAKFIATQAGVPSPSVTLIAARTASLAGGVQVVARSVETALHKLHALEFDLTRVQAGFGLAPTPPVAGDDLGAIGRTNDAMLYGARVNLYMTADDDQLQEVGPKLPASASSDYGRPFGEIFASYDHDFYKIDPHLFSPAQIVLHNLKSGRIHRFGAVNEDVLQQSFFKCPDDG